MSKNLCQSNSVLFENYTTHLEKTYNFPPLASKIQAYMVLYSNNEGFTFEDFLEIFKVSKSSLSTSINWLLSLNQIEYYHKIDSRKRYFRLNLNYLPDKLEFLHDIVTRDLSFTKRISDYKLKNQLVNLLKDEGILDVYTEYLENSEKLLKETIIKIKSIQLENK
ncbi:hypothetical protein [Faecalibacter rhinopitheci]|uniref:MarR family transcriptional regulator n=1 Tax=Faecalibacter rhinopitheci TaxID=2779678 RepID=A0A8J7G4A7_9FLAO|nr:hypothetical protein [Faecalibacter rhinopitheci]MBF0596015.1 hypothetical protein [Faecalibacter rhinopitheci]MBQ0148692.1 hypothetical protein [Candidatus Onthonaster equi]